MSTVAVARDQPQARKFASSLEAIFNQYYDAVGIDKLESVLRQRITEYLIRPKKSYQSMANDIRHSLIEKFEPLLSEDEFKVFIKKRALSHTYIWKFHKKNESVCIVYLNTLANFLGVRFIVMNFDVLPGTVGYCNG